MVPCGAAYYVTDTVLGIRVVHVVVWKPKRRLDPCQGVYHKARLDSARASSTKDSVWAGLLANDSNGFKASCIQRQDVVAVLQQDSGVGRELASQLSVLRGCNVAVEQWMN